MSWEATYGLLILFSTLTTWISGIYIGKQENASVKKRILIVAIIANLFVLYIFKYADFISTVLNQFFGFAHIRMQLPLMNLLLPIGLSFYTFQVIAYLIDVFRGEIKPERNFLIYAVFVSFFPQLVAGPIERAKNLLPQFHREHSFDSDQFIEGLKMMAWGYFMKLCIADRVSPYVDAVFNNYLMHNGFSLLLGTFFFSFQIFGDFGGYSLIAMGVAKCFNFNLTQNFHRPYLSSNIRVFWRRWHRSLSNWFLDYVYIPLGGSRCPFPGFMFNLFITFIISGFWHGSNWTFLLWGALHGFLVMGYAVKNKFFPVVRPPSPLQTFLNSCFTFILVMFIWIFFRAPDVETSFIILKKIFTEPGVVYNGFGIPETLLGVFCIGLLMFKEIKDEMGLNIHFIHHKNTWVSAISLALLIGFILLFAEFSGEAFIYFQF
jgi:D-alanyl-lipoteichoic acid acyltransferase DltB (MBOAT superfamily)